MRPPLRGGIPRAAALACLLVVSPRAAHAEHAEHSRVGRRRDSVGGAAYEYERRVPRQQRQAQEQEVDGRSLGQRGQLLFLERAGNAGGAAPVDIIEDFTDRDSYGESIAHGAEYGLPAFLRRRRQQQRHPQKARDENLVMENQEEEERRENGKALEDAPVVSEATSPGATRAAAAAAATAAAAAAAAGLMALAGSFASSSESDHEDEADEPYLDILGLASPVAVDDDTTKVSVLRSDERTATSGSFAVGHRPPHEEGSASEPASTTAGNGGAVEGDGAVVRGLRGSGTAGVGRRAGGSGREHVRLDYEERDDGGEVGKGEVSSGGRGVGGVVRALQGTTPAPTEITVTETPDAVVTPAPAPAVSISPTTETVEPVTTETPSPQAPEAPVVAETTTPFATESPAGTVTAAPVEAETTAPAAAETPAPAEAGNTPAPAPTDTTTSSADVTIAPTSTLTAEEGTLTPAPTLSLESEGTFAPGDSSSGSISPSTSTSSSTSLSPSASVSPSAVSLAPGETLVPSGALDEGVTLAPAASSSQSALFPETVSPTQFPGGTPSSGATLSPGATSVPTSNGSAPSPATIFPTVTLFPAVTLSLDETISPTLTLLPTVTLSPAETFSPTLTLSPALTISPTETVSPTNTLSPTVTLDLADTFSPTATLSPAETVSPTVTRSPALTISPTETMSPTATLGPTLTMSPTVVLDPNGTSAPGAIPTLTANTVSPTTETTSEADVSLEETAAPSMAPTIFNETNQTTADGDLGTTGDVASGAAAAGVAATAATVTVTTITATTATATTTTTVATVASSTSAAGGSSTGATSIGLPDASTLRVSNANSRLSLHGGSSAESVQTTTVSGVKSSSVSYRSPSAAMGLLMIFQLQTVSLLRMLDANITKPFMNFLDNLKWLNLHFEVDLGILSCDNADSTYAWANTDNDTFALNTFFVFALLALLITFHIMLLSYMEASWLSRSNAIHEHRLRLMREKAAIDGQSAAAYAEYLDLQNADRELDEQERISTERYLKRHNSVWMYFPHVELLFLLFTYQGASAAEAQMIASGCIPLAIFGVFALVVFPLLMLVYVTRIVWRRVRPENAPVVFRQELCDNRGGGCFSRSIRGICEAWKDGESMFSWADKGKWMSKNDENVDLDSRKFRIGFEPLFVDYTQRGAVYLSFLLFEWLAFGIIAGFVPDGTVQTSTVFLIYFVDLMILICLRPFSNSFIQGIQTLTVLADVLTVALMAYASVLDPDDDSDNDRLEIVYGLALLIQTLAIVFLIIPIYLDAFVLITGSIMRKCYSMAKGTVKEEKIPIHGTRGDTRRIFCILLRENFIGCAKSTVKGPTYKPISAAEQLHKQNSARRAYTKRQLSSLHELDESAEDESEHGRLPRSVYSQRGPVSRREMFDSTGSALVEIDLAPKTPDDGDAAAAPYAEPGEQDRPHMGKKTSVRLGSGVRAASSRSPNGS